MILLISAWYNEPRYSFRFSHKVTNFIRDQIREKLLPKYGLDKKDEQWYLNLVIATDSKTKELEVRGPDVKKRQKFTDFGLWLPYTLNKDPYPLASFLDYVFEALVIVFRSYGVLENDIREIERECKAEMLHNESYAGSA